MDSEPQVFRLPLGRQGLRASLTHGLDTSTSGHQAGTKGAPSRGQARPGAIILGRPGRDTREVSGDAVHGLSRLWQAELREEG